MLCQLSVRGVLTSRAACWSPPHPAGGWRWGTAPSQWPAARTSVGGRSRGQRAGMRPVEMLQTREAGSLQGLSEGSPIRATCASPARSASPHLLILLQDLLVHRAARLVLGPAAAQALVSQGANRADTDSLRCIPTIGVVPAVGHLPSLACGPLHLLSWPSCHPPNSLPSSLGDVCEDEVEALGGVQPALHHHVRKAAGRQSAGGGSRLIGRHLGWLEEWCTSTCWQLYRGTAH